MQKYYNGKDSNRHNTGKDHDNDDDIMVISVFIVPRPYQAIDLRV